MTQNPLAYRMRPTHIQDIIGQDHLVGEGKIIYRMIKANQLASMILYGPPGTGKTSMAFALAKTLNLPVKKLNAVVEDRKSTRLNSSHVSISYAVFCL